MLKYFFQVVFVSLPILLLGQSTQWASKIIGYSSQNQDYYYSAKQALGVPNAVLGMQSEMVWAPKNESSNRGEYLHVGFEKPMKISQVAVVENLNPGSIKKIIAYDSRRRPHIVYEKKVKPVGFKRPAYFRTKFKKTDFMVVSLRVELDTKAIPGMNTIDAIAISSSSQSIQSKPNVINYASEVSLPERMSSAINSMFPERLPIISPSGKKLFFARKYHPHNTEGKKDDIWFSDLREDGTWTNAKRLKAPINDEHHNFVIGTSPNGKILYFSNSKFKSGIGKAAYNTNKKNRIKTIEIPNFKNVNKFVNYHFDESGKIILMSIENENSIGDRDFFVSFKKNRKWTTPINLGADINTVGMENGIFLAADKRTIYFSSNGHPGFGGLDVFMSRRLDDTWQSWSKPINIGKILNSPKNDFNFSVPASGAIAYFASGSMDNSDIFHVELPKELKPKPVKYYKPIIVDIDGNIIKAKLKLESLESDEVMVMNDGDDFIFSEDNPVHVLAEADGYYAVADANIMSSKYEDLDYEGQSSQRNMERISSLKNHLSSLKNEISNLKSKLNNQNQNKTKIDKLKNKLSQSSSKTKDKLKDYYDNKKNKEKTKPVEKNEMYEEIQREIIEALPTDIKEILTKEELIIAKPVVQEETLNEEEIEDYKNEVAFSIKAKLEKLIEEEIEQEEALTSNIIENEPEEVVEDVYEEVESKVIMVPIEVGQVIPMNNVFFDSNVANLKAVSKNELGRVLDFLNSNSKLKVEVGGHTNGLCSRTFAIELSEERAKVVRQYFIDAGISENRITFKGYGRAKPIASNKTINGRKKNQRVELTILEIL